MDVSVDRLMEAVPVPVMIKVLRFFRVKVLAHQSARHVASMLALQLHYETDTDDSDSD